MQDRLGLGRPGALRLALGLAALLPACGPVSTTLALRDAETALDVARKNGADQFAVYEFRSAELYLAKAREEEGGSDFQAAIDLAEQARKLAEAAHARAGRGGSGLRRAPRAPAAAPNADAPPAGDTRDAPTGSQL